MFFSSGYLKKGEKKEEILKKMAFVSRKEKNNMEQTYRYIHNVNLAKFKSGQTACGAS